MSLTEIFVQYGAPIVVAIVYVLFVRFTRQQLARSSCDALGAYIEGVGAAHPEAQDRLRQIATDAQASDGRTGLTAGPKQENILGAWRVARASECSVRASSPATRLRLAWCRLRPPLEEMTIPDVEISRRASASS